MASRSVKSLKRYIVKSVNCCDSYIVAAEIVEDLEAALQQLAAGANDLKK
jgi:hypothetical protein